MISTESTLAFLLKRIAEHPGMHHSNLLGDDRATNVPPVAPVQMAEAPAVSEAGSPTSLSEAGSHASLESFPRLNWERGYGWCAARNMGALTAVETVEMNRRNALRITPQEVA